MFRRSVLIKREAITRRAAAREKDDRRGLAACAACRGKSRWPKCRLYAGGVSVIRAGAPYPSSRAPEPQDISSLPSRYFLFLPFLLPYPYHPLLLSAPQIKLSPNKKSPIFCSTFLGCHPFIPPPFHSYASRFGFYFFFLSLSPLYLSPLADFPFYKILLKDWPRDKLFFRGGRKGTRKGEREWIRSVKNVSKRRAPSVGYSPRIVAAPRDALSLLREPRRIGWMVSPDRN